jgi:hypothetical protein
MWLVYATTLLITLVGLLLRNHRTVRAVAGATLTGSVIFFVITNFGVWISGAPDLYGNPYPQTFQGLMACYAYGIPFFANSLLGDAVYSTILFGGFALAEMYLPALRQLKVAREPQKEIA